MQDKTNSTIRFLDPKNMVQDTKIISLAAFV